MAFGPFWPDMPEFLWLFVDDAVYRQALKAGATPVTNVTDRFFGDQLERIRNTLGNIRWVQAHLEDLDEREIQKRAGDKAAMGAMAYVQSSLDAAMAQT